MPGSQHTIAGTVLTMPIEIRKANLHTAMFAVRAESAQRMIDYSGLRVCEVAPGRALVILMLVRYVDGDLGKYHEFGTAVMVNPPDVTTRGPLALRSAGAFIHHLPVDQTFTLEAGQRIWGFPKVMADFTVRDVQQFGFDISVDGQLVAGMEFSPGLPIPSRPGQQVLRTYSHRDGITREIPWEMRLSGVRWRPGGARLWLGDHPYAKELEALGLPKRALTSTSADHLRMSFGDAHEVH